ncbi:MAG: hypothetical protein CL997_01395 [Euryarchaeota archaeon]|nr:hypothetical protein [Euryarchaeota archaeon]
MTECNTPALPISRRPMNMTGLCVKPISNEEGVYSTNSFLKNQFKKNLCELNYILVSFRHRHDYTSGILFTGIQSGIIFWIEDGH